MSANRLQRPGLGEKRRDAVIGLPLWLAKDIRKRLLDALSWLFETWKISQDVKNETAVDAYADMSIFRATRHASAGGFGIIISLREVSACSFDIKGNSRASNSGMDRK